MDIWAQEVGKLTLPISGSSPTGDDPRYSDEFSLLKAEIEKKSDVNFEKISELCERILVDVSKDLRVVSYYTMALSRMEGLSGLSRGIATMLSLIDQYADALHPLKPKVRLSALKWFQQEKLLIFAKASTKNVSEEFISSFLALYKEFFAVLSGYCGEPMSWPELDAWLKKEQKALTSMKKEAATATAKPEAPESSVVTGPALAQGDASIAPINSNAAYTQCLRHLLNYFKEQKLYGKLVGTAYACQWGNLKLPPNEQGKTRLPVSRKASLARIQNAMDNQHWEEALVACVDAFMEPSGQFNFVVTKRLHECANQIGNQEIALVLEAQLHALTERLPKLMQLRFENEEPFAPVEVMSWVEQLTDMRNSSATEGNTQGYKGLLAEARAVLKKDGVDSAFSFLAESPVSNDLDRAFCEFSKAMLCLDKKRSDIALPIFHQLEVLIDSLSLRFVLPDFAMQVWKQLYRLYSEKLNNTDESEARRAIEEKQDRLRSLMCTTDVANAIQWL